jgi:hypothetical protein
MELLTHLFDLLYQFFVYLVLRNDLLLKSTVPLLKFAVDFLPLYE